VSYNHVMDVETDPVESEPWCTQEEFWRFCQEHEDDLHHYELLNGRIVMNPPAGWPHGGGTGLLTVIHTFVRSHRLGSVLSFVQGFEFPTGDTVAPDIAFVSKERWHAAPRPKSRRFLKMVPDLVVELLSGSTSSRDRGEKKGIYERNGVLEYWIVSLEKPEIARFVLRDSSYGMPTVFGMDDTFESVILEGLRFSVRDILPQE
jgi:Uma2 family endonuclease